MSFEIFDPEARQETQQILPLEKTRADLLGQLRKNPVCDVLVVGGGIHGAAFARSAALCGLRTILIERHDYASATSSRSSKLAHGGLRYLELFDFQQVIEGVKARESWFKTSGHIVHPKEFFIPISKSARWLKTKMHLGLPVYDFMVAEPGRKHRWVDAAGFQSMGIPAFPGLAGGFLYYDGVMNDLRLVLENIYAARQEGALCLNYCSLQSFSQEKSGEVRCGCFDQLDKETFEIRTGVIVNCAGPWVPSVGRVRPADWSNRVRYSKGIHLLFNFHWQGPALLLPLGPRGRYYFVLPHHAGTLVGTTEAELTKPEFDPLPNGAEIQELLSNVRRDVPDPRFCKENIHYCFAGIRTLAARERGAGTSKISRKHEWLYTDGMLSLIGGKYTTAYWTVEEGMRKLEGLSGAQIQLSLKDRILPGAAELQENLAEFRKQAREQRVSEQVIERACARYGSLVRHFIDRGPLLAIGDFILKQEVEYACEIEQVQTLEDLMRRRLELEYLPGHGLDVLDQVADILLAWRPDINLEQEKSEYRDRMKRIATLLQSA